MRIINAANPHEEVEFANVHGITIYADGVKLFETDRTHFQECHTGAKYFTEDYFGKCSSINLSHLPKRAIKENLNRKDHYYRSHENRWEKGVWLYLHASDIRVEDLGEKLTFENDEQRCYFHAYALTFIHGYNMIRHHIEDVPGADGKWTPPEGGKWHDGYGPSEDRAYYDIITPTRFNGIPQGETRVVKRWITRETCCRMETKSGPYSRIEYSKEELDRKALCKIINDAKVFSREIGTYELKRLQALCNISLKEAP